MCPSYWGYFCCSFHTFAAVNHYDNKTDVKQ